MGRDKGHQRVKGNVKPASSGRSAELATTAGTVTFASLASGSSGASFVPLIPEPDETGLDAQIALILRKLGKKDATTKLKAEAELDEACKNDESIPTVILPYWPKIYTRLAVDDHKKVRELAHGLLEIIATTVGRNLAPQTKALIPTLFLSQSDTFAPAASAARSAFNSVFPTEEKQKQAISFCIAELSATLNERLGWGTELGKITFLDGMNRLLRLGIGAELYESLDFALKQQGFWAMGADETAIVRKTFFDVVSTIAETAGDRIPKSKLSAALKTGFESERLEVQSLWNCFLTLAINGVFQEKSVAEAQIVICTKNSFYGHASQLGPLLLPLVAKLGVPPQIFESLQEGFLAEKSHVERQAIVRTYAEILSFYYKETEQVPESAFPFITSQLTAMAEFGRTLSALVKKDSFYDSLAQFCLERSEVMQNPNLGAFVISFFKDKRNVKFSDATEQKSIYDFVLQKEFLRKMSLGILQVKNFVAFAAIAKWLSGSSFLSDLLTPSEIPNLFPFETEKEDKVVELRISLELIKSFPESPEALALLASIFLQFKDSAEDLEIFAREVEPFDKIKELKRWLKSGVFNDEIVLKSNALSKYVLGRKEIFGEEIIQAKLDLLVSCPQEHLDLARELVHDASKSSVDMTPFFLAIWDAFLDDKSEECGRLEEIGSQIVEKDLVPRNVLYSRINEKAGEVERLEDLHRLITISQKLMSDQLVEPDEVTVTIDPDLLVFRGFGFSYLKVRELEAAAEFTSSKILRQVILNTKVILANSSVEDDILKSVAMNLLYAACLVDISKDDKRRILETTAGTVENEIYDKVNALLSIVLEELAKHSQLKQFWNTVNEKSSDVIWTSRYPVMKLVKVCKRMELHLPKQTEQIEINEVLKEITTQSVIDFLRRLTLDCNPPYEKFIEVITAQRNQCPEHFHFDESFNSLEAAEKDKLLGLLEIVIGLIGKNNEFASVASCWVSAWLKQAVDKYDSDKSSYFWMSKLSHAVVLLTTFSQTEPLFSEEFTEFHAPNIFPVVYRHFLHLAASEEYWAIEAAQNVAEAITLIPTAILNTLLEEPSKAFELFLPVTLRQEIIFKVAGHSLLSKVTLTKEILPREFEAFSKRFRKGGPRSEEAKVSFILLWNSLLRSQPNAFEFANYVKEVHLLPQALNLIFCDLLDSSAVPSLKTYFDTDPIISCGSISSITHLAAWLLQNLMRALPYTVRWWWASLGNKGTKAHVERITTKFLSAKLAAEDLNKVQWDGEDNVSVNSHPGCNELIARYKIEETSVTLKITLPLNHPLGPVTVAVSDKKLHARISQLLNTRSHSLAAGLRLWKESLDTVYKDADECAICFFILQHQTKQLPKLGCKTCKKKFHATCLYKWFSTSNKSECPLCRNLW